MKYEVVLKKWLADQRIYQKYSTYTCYANIVENHLLPHLGQLEEVTTDIVQDFALRLLESGNRVTGGGLSQSFVRDILTVIKITCPHVGEIRLPYEPPKEIEIFGQPEMVALVNHLQSSQTGGEYKHTLSVDEMPSHYHASKPLWVAGGGNGSNNCVSGYPTTGKAGQYGINTENTGGGKSHNNVQPWATAYFWRRSA